MTTSPVESLEKQAEVGYLTKGVIRNKGVDALRSFTQDPKHELYNAKIDYSNPEFNSNIDATMNEMNTAGVLDSKDPDKIKAEFVRRMGVQGSPAYSAYQYAKSMTPGYVKPSANPPVAPQPAQPGTSPAPVAPTVQPAAPPPSIPPATPSATPSPVPPATPMVTTPSVPPATQPMVATQTGVLDNLVTRATGGEELKPEEWDQLISNPSILNEANSSYIKDGSELRDRQLANPGNVSASSADPFRMFKKMPVDKKIKFTDNILDLQQSQFQKLVEARDQSPTEWSKAQVDGEINALAGQHAKAMSGKLGYEVTGDHMKSLWTMDPNQREVIHGVEAQVASGASPMQAAWGAIQKDPMNTLKTFAMNPFARNIMLGEGKKAAVEQPGMAILIGGVALLGIMAVVKMGMGMFAGGDDED